VKSDSLKQLSVAFERWRAKRRHAREKTPERLVMRARRAAQTYGLARVSRAVKLDRRRLDGAEPGQKGRRANSVAAPPAYSRVELVGATATSRPFAELELPTGIKLRLFAPAPETMSLLSAVCSSGVDR
jgi:hypothetical protein